MAVANLTDLGSARDACARPPTACASSACVRADPPIRPSRALRPNDIIVEVEGQPVKNAAELDDADAAPRSGTKGRVKLLVDVRSRPRAAPHRRRGRHVDERRSAARGEEGVGAGGRAGADAAAGRAARPQGQDRRARDALARCEDAAQGRRHHSRRRRRPGPRDRGERRGMFAAMIRRYQGRDRRSTLTVYRDGKEMPLPVTLVADADAAARDEALRRTRSSNSAPATSPRPIATDPELRTSTGVLVESVAARGWAALGRLNGGDVILAIDGTARAERRRLQARHEGHPDDASRRRSSSRSGAASARCSSRFSRRGDKACHAQASDSGHARRLPSRSAASGAAAGGAERRRARRRPRVVRSAATPSSWCSRRSSCASTSTAASSRAIRRRRRTRRCSTATGLAVMSLSTLSPTT